MCYKDCIIAFISTVLLVLFSIALGFFPVPIASIATILPDNFILAVTISTTFVSTKYSITSQASLISRAAFTLVHINCKSLAYCNLNHCYLTEHLHYYRSKACIINIYIILSNTVCIYHQCFFTTIPIYIALPVITNAIKAPRAMLLFIIFFFILSQPFIKSLN